MDTDEGVDIQSTIDKHCTLRMPCFAHTLQLVVKDGLGKLNAKSTRQLTAKCTKLCNLTHQSALFRDAFEAKFGRGRSLPKATDTRWNSTFRHLCSISNLDQAILATLLREQSQHNLIISAKEFAILQELVEILQPFAEATDLTQGESYPTIGCIVPSIVALDSCLLELSARVVHHASVIKALQESLRRRFIGLFQRVQILPAVSGVLTNDAFGSILYFIASLLDPTYGLLWLEDHPALVDVKQVLKDEIIGIMFLSFS